MSFRMTKHRSIRGFLQRGSAMVEAVLVVPVLLLLISSTYELGSVFQQYLIMQQVAYEGARAASQLTVDDLKNTSCYRNNASDLIRSNHIPSASNPALVAILARVEAMLDQARNTLTLGCDDQPRLNENYCTSPVNIGRPSYAAEFIKATDSVAWVSCQIPFAKFPNKKGTVGVRVSGKYVGRVFPFSLYLSAESRAMLLADNQGFSIPPNQGSPSRP